MFEGPTRAGMDLLLEAPRGLPGRDLIELEWNLLLDWNLLEEPDRVCVFWMEAAADLMLLEWNLLEASRMEVDLGEAGG